MSSLKSLVANKEMQVKQSEFIDIYNIIQYLYVTLFVCLFVWMITIQTQGFLCRYLNFTLCIDTRLGKVMVAF